jgi:hypothetical protein
MASVEMGRAIGFAGATGGWTNPSGSGASCKSAGRISVATPATGEMAASTAWTAS